MQIHKRIVEASKKVNSEISKFFTAMTGKNGGILHGQCPCGSTYDMKFLTLPGGVSDLHRNHYVCEDKANYNSI